MADIVLGIGTSHSPMLTLAPEHWDIRTDADRAEQNHPYRGKTYNFDELLEIMPRDKLAKLNAVEERRARFERSDKCLDLLAQTLEEVNPDVLVIIGDDQHEWFLDDVQPAFTLFYGDEVFAKGFDAKATDVPEPMIPVRLSYTTPVDHNYPADSSVASRIITQTIEDGFDITASKLPPSRGGGPVGIGHAFGFIYRRLLNDKPVPFVPVMINTYYPPNQPTAKRCYEFGQSIGRALAGIEDDKRIAIVASGGLTHFVIDEDFDHRLIDAMQSGDVEKLTADPNTAYQSGTSEIKNWIALCGVMAGTGLKMTLHDYVPCYRSEAGTGTAMAFATWC